MPLWSCPRAGPDRSWSSFCAPFGQRSVAVPVWCHDGPPKECCNPWSSYLTVEAGVTQWWHLVILKGWNVRQVPWDWNQRYPYHPNMLYWNHHFIWGLPLMPWWSFTVHLSPLTLSSHTARATLTDTPQDRHSHIHIEGLEGVAMCRKNCPIPRILRFDRQNQRDLRRLRTLHQ